MPSTTNLEEVEILDDLGKDGNASMPEQVNQPKPWGKMMMIKLYVHMYFNVIDLCMILQLIDK